MPSDAAAGAVPAPAPRLERGWWRQSVVYQVYPRSFADADGDGTGDIAGIRSRLGYLAGLGVDAIWISPWYPSPLNDGGYDVADYRDIDPRYGTLADAEALLADAHELGIGVIIDLVPNHTSSEHRWFRAAVAAGPGSAERERYWFRPGRGPGGAEPPNNWSSVFGGPAWTQLPDGEWYLHLFDPTQPDLNWTNPEVLEEFDDIFRFWIDRHVEGFRIDVAHSLAKDPTLPDVDLSPDLLGATRAADHPHWDRPEVHEIIRRWRKVIDDASDGRAMMVAEAWVEPHRRPLYLRHDEYHQSFNFDLLETPWDAVAYRDTIRAAHADAEEVGSTNTWTLSNHDVMRHATRLGLPDGTDWRAWLLDGPHEVLDADLGARRARAASMLLLALPGSVYLYQGEELGLPEVWDLPTDVLDDPVWENSGRTYKGRDGCRVPMPWTPDGPSFGFGTDGAWLPQPAVYGELAAAAQQGVEGSSLELYRRALRLRREHLVDDESIEWLDDDRSVLAFRRGSGVVCSVNFGPEPVDLPPGEVILSSSPLDDATVLPTDTTVWTAPPG